MRSHGNLIKWNEARGFGFVRSSQGHEELFVHVSAFPRDGIRPSVGELISFEVESAPDGKRRAVRVMRPGGRGASDPLPRRVRAAASAPASRGSSFGRKLFRGLLVVGLAYVGFEAYERFPDHSPAPPPDSVSASARLATPAPPPRFHCDGREHCSQMRSYEEAMFFLQSCPGTRMDGDNDGIPCEQQFGR
jgi:cold shock CspA family protein